MTGSDPSDASTEAGRLRAMFNHMLDGYSYNRVVFDADGKAIDFVYLDVNPAFVRLSGMPRETFIGRPVTEVLPGIENDPADWIGRYGRVVTTGEPAQFESHSAVLGRWFRVSAYSPEPEHFALIFEDITERKEQDARRQRLIADLEHKNAELERFVYTMSHDLRSPLITMRAYCDTLLEQAESLSSEQGRLDLERIAVAANQMYGRIEDVLQIARAGTVVGQARPVALNPIIDEALATHADALAEHGVAVNVAPDLPTVQGDRERLVEVFDNLIENAIRFRGASTPNIDIRVEARGNHVLIAVADNGRGLDQDQLGRVFDVFHKVEPSGRGSGIGLAIVRRTVELHGGRVWMESPGLGQGATFKFTLPTGDEELG